MKDENEQLKLLTVYTCNKHYFARFICSFSLFVQKNNSMNNCNNPCIYKENRGFGTLRNKVYIFSDILVEIDTTIDEINVKLHFSLE